jgi:hypothetical protein
MQDDFLNIKKETNKKSKFVQNLAYKEIVSIVSKSSLKIKNNIKWDKDENKTLNGWVSFSISLKDLGFTIKDVKFKYNKEFFSHFIIDFIGEILIRTNANIFIDEIFTVDENEYLSMVSKERHKRFGATLDETSQTVIFSFHVSLLQNMLTEDFKFHLF